jgi:hypothetical protein
LVWAHKKTPLLVFSMHIWRFCSSSLR